MTVKVLVVGGGAREHAMAAAAARGGAEVYAILKNRNPGIARLARETRHFAETDVAAVADQAKRWGVDIAVAGPEAPLAAGVSDALAAAGIPCAAPTKAAAEVESSKAFMRALLARHRIEGRLEYALFDDDKGLKAYIEDLGPVAIKPVGLTGGKGVKVTGDHLKDADDAFAYAKEILATRLGGAQVLVEELAVGEEFTVMAWCDGTRTVPMPAVQDHKRAWEGDKGPNTGGMGTYSDADGLLPFLPREDYEAAAHVVQHIVDALRKEERPYVGPIYGQFMLTAEGPKVIEVNARFGDPEAMNALALLRSNYVDVLFDMAEGHLPARLDWYPEATVCKYVVPAGYGESPKADTPVVVDEKAVRTAGAEAYYAAVNAEEGAPAGDVVRVRTTSSRSVGVVARGATLEEADAKVEAALAHVRGEAIYVRHDIGSRALVQARVDHMLRLGKGKGAAREG